MATNRPRGDLVGWKNNFRSGKTIGIFSLYQYKEQWFDGKFQVENTVLKYVISEVSHT